MEIDSSPARRGTGGSPFLSAAAAARIAGLTPSTLARRLVAGELPGYRLGRRWFVPEEEFRRHLRRRAWMLQPDATDDMVAELTDALPPTLGIDDLERFFGLRRPFLYDALRISPFAGLSGRGAVTTIGVVRQALLEARNDCTPCVARDARCAPACDVA